MEDGSAGGLQAKNTLSCKPIAVQIHYAVELCLYKYAWPTLMHFRHNHVVPAGAGVGADDLDPPPAPPEDLVPDVDELDCGSFVKLGAFETFIDFEEKMKVAESGTTETILLRYRFIAITVVMTVREVEQTYLGMSKNNTRYWDACPMESLMIERGSEEKFGSTHVVGSEHVSIHFRPTFGGAADEVENRSQVTSVVLYFYGYVFPHTNHHSKKSARADRW
jgi:hypothetical protein